jgi:hypothetical protein
MIQGEFLNGGVSSVGGSVRGSVRGSVVVTVVTVMTAVVLGPSSNMVVEVMDLLASSVVNILDIFLGLVPVESLNGGIVALMSEPSLNLVEKVVHLHVGDQTSALEFALDFSPSRMLGGVGDVMLMNPFLNMIENLVDLIVSNFVHVAKLILHIFPSESFSLSAAFGSGVSGGRLLMEPSANLVKEAMGLGNSGILNAAEGFLGTSPIEFFNGSGSGVGRVGSVGGVVVEVNPSSDLIF